VWRERERERDVQRQLFSCWSPCRWHMPKDPQRIPFPRKIEPRADQSAETKSKFKLCVEVWIICEWVSECTRIRTCIRFVFVVLFAVGLWQDLRHFHHAPFTARISHFPATLSTCTVSQPHTHTCLHTYTYTHMLTWGKLNEACVIDFMFVKNGRKRSTLDWPFDDSSLSICLQYSWHSISIELQKSRESKEIIKKSKKQQKNTNFVGLQRVKCIKWPLTGKKQNLSFNRKQNRKHKKKNAAVKATLQLRLPNSQSDVASSKRQVASGSGRGQQEAPLWWVHLWLYYCYSRGSHLG